MATRPSPQGTFVTGAKQFDAHRLSSCLVYPSPSPPRRWEDSFLTVLLRNESPNHHEAVLCVLSYLVNMFPVFVCFLPKVPRIQFLFIQAPAEGSCEAPHRRNGMATVAMGRVVGFRWDWRDTYVVESISIWGHGPKHGCPAAGQCPCMAVL